jgi:hypothetical protein
MPRHAFLRNMSRPEPVKPAPLTEEQWRRIEHRYGLFAGLALSGLALIVYLLIVWRPVCP